MNEYNVVQREKVGRVAAVEQEPAVREGLHCADGVRTVQTISRQTQPATSAHHARRCHG